jgi:hypothetical protein
MNSVLEKAKIEGEVKVINAAKSPVLASFKSEPSLYVANASKPR